MIIVTRTAARLRSTWVLAVSVAYLAGARLLAAQPLTGTPDGFVPMSELPAAEQLPAAPLVVGAYAFVWVALMIYLWSIWRRLGKVDSELQALERRGNPRGRA